ncbi:MAG: prolyl oligopeptidase family serine peptidase [Anaerolineae bacterium]
MKRIIVETYPVRGIPIMTLAQENAKNCPVVFFIHGFTSDKSEGLALGYRLAKRGFYFVSVDAYMHGQRLNPGLKNVWNPAYGNRVYPLETGLDPAILMYQVIAQTVQDVGVLVEHLEKDPRADMSCLGVSGSSMGAGATYCLAATNPKFQVAVPFIGMPAFAERMEDVVIECSSYDKWSQTFHDLRGEIEKMMDFIRVLDPFEKMGNFCPKPLMMINGEHDLESPKIYSIRLYEYLKPFYTQHPEKLKLNIHDGVAHTVTTEMLEDACDWFSKYLLQ